MDGRITVFTDGGSRGNPGESALGVVIMRNNTVLTKIGQRLGITTNNVAEYSAIVAALTWIDANRESLGNIAGISFFMDSQLACLQLKGVYKVRQAHLQALLSTIRKHENKLGVEISYTHIPREKNKEADKMVNLALDNLL